MAEVMTWRLPHHEHPWSKGVRIWTPNLGDSQTKMCENQMTQHILGAYFLRQKLNLMSSVERGLTAFPAAKNVFANTRVRGEYNSFICDVYATSAYSCVPGPEEL